jgi:hypothetical protein
LNLVAGFEFAAVDSASAYGVVMVFVVAVGAFVGPEVVFEEEEEDASVLNLVDFDEQKEMWNEGLVAVAVVVDNYVVSDVVAVAVAVAVVEAGDRADVVGVVVVVTAVAVAVVQFSDIAVVAVVGEEEVAIVS